MLADIMTPHKKRANVHFISTREEIRGFEEYSGKEENSIWL